MLNRTHIAVDITNSDIRVVSFQGSQIKKWLSSPIPAGLIKDGVIQDPLAMSIVMDSLFQSLNLKRNGLLCTLTGLPFLYRTISMPGTRRSVKSEAIERAARAEMSVAEEDMVLAWQALEKPSAALETDYFVTGVPRTALNPFLETLNKAKIRPARIEMKPLALARAASCSDAVIISLEKEFFDIVLVFNGLVRVIHSFGNAIKPSDSFGLVNEMVDGLNIAIKSYNRDFPQYMFPADIPIFLAGFLAAGEAVPSMVQEATGHPVSLLQSTLSVPFNLPPELYAASLGLISSRKPVSRQNSSYFDIDINLLDGLKKRQPRRLQPGYALAGAAAVILLLLLFKVYSLRADAREDVVFLEKAITTEATQLSTYQKSAEVAESTKKATLAKYQALENELKALKEKNRTVAELKTDFATSLSSMTNALPASTRFQSIFMRKDNIIFQGTAGDSLDVLNLVTIFEKQSVFSGARVKTMEPLKEGGFSFELAIFKVP